MDKVTVVTVEFLGGKIEVYRTTKQPLVQDGCLAVPMDKGGLIFVPLTSVRLVDVGEENV